MRKLLIILTILMTFVTQSFASCENPNPHGKIQSIYVSVPGRVFIYLSDEPGIRIKGDSLTRRYITYGIKDGVLIIKSVPGMEEYLIEKSPEIYISIDVEDVNIISTRNFSIDRKKTKSGNHVKK